MEKTDQSGNVGSGPARTFREGRERDRILAGADIGPASLSLFSRIIEVWKIPDERALQLLALTPGTSLKDLDFALLGEEQLLRISCLIAIYKALHMYWQDELADCWVRLGNRNSMFGGQSPLEYMFGGGLPALSNVRTLLDGWCQGNE